MISCIAIDKGERTKAYREAAENMKLNIVLVDCMANDIISQLKGADALIWHWSHSNYKEKRAAKSILTAAHKMGIKIYPNLNTCGSFDDKIAQKYLLEALDAPLAKSYVFFDKEEAIQFLHKCEYPIVSKLAGGAGSSNVELINNFTEGRRLCKERFYSYPELKTLFGRNRNLRSALSFFVKGHNERYMGLDKGYLLLQEYLPDNNYDIRVTIIGKKAVIFRRYVRENDFRASGSGKIDYVVSHEDKNAIKIAFDISQRLNTQTLAFDFAYDSMKNLKLIEISYGFVSKAVENAGGYYNEEMNWIEEAVVVETEIIKLLKEQIEQEKHVQ